MEIPNIALPKEDPVISNIEYYEYFQKGNE